VSRRWATLSSPVYRSKPKGFAGWMRDGGPFPMEREGAFPLRRRTARDRHQVPAGGPDPRPRHPAADEVRAPPYPPPPQPGRDGGGGWVPLQSSQRSPPRGPLPRPRRQLALQAQPFPKAIAEVYGGDLVEEVDDNPEELAPLRPARGGARGEEVGGGGGGPPPSGVVTGVRASSARKPPRLDLLTFLTREWGRDIFVGTCLPCTGSARRPVMVMKGTMSYFL